MVLAAAAVAWAAGCGSSASVIPPGTPDPDRVLFERATEELREERWVQARDYFRQIVDNYPQSQHRAEAKLGLGDTYLGQGTVESYVLAINEFREFLTFYPTHQRADYAQYKLGMSYFEQMLNPDRDQTNTKSAIGEFELFLERYPNSSLRGEVEARLRDARDRLSESEFRVGRFYYRIRWFPGAIDRFRAILESDPEYTNRDAVYYYLAESLLETERAAEALPYYERLISEFETSEYLADARKRIAELKRG